MISLFGTLNMGAQSLDVEQEASVLTGNNLANVNNPSYARERLTIQSATPLDTPQGEEGTGVTSGEIEEVRDSALDSQIVGQNSVTGSLTEQQSALQDAEAYLNEQVQNSSSSSAPAGSFNGIANSLSSLFNSFQSLSLDPTDLSQRQTAVAAAQQLASQFNQVSTQLSNVASGINQTIQTNVADANQDLSDIANLNQEIAQATASGGSADTLVDQRQAKLEDLASQVNISTSTETNGAVDVSIGGVTMVSGFTNADQLQTYDAGGGQILVKAANAGTPLTLTGGSIEGGITARDGALASLQSGLNQVASNLIGQVNAIYSGGHDLNGNSGQNFFTGSGAANIAVNSSLVADPSTFQASGSATASGDNTTVLALAALGNQSIGALGGQTFTQSYAATVTGLGNSIASVNDQLTNSQSVAQMLGNQRSSVSGVNTDEEMTNLISYQKAYEASAQLISTINQMLETVISMKAS